MKNIFSLLITVLPFIAFSQRTITGRVFDITNNRPLPHANILIQNTKKGIAADNNGNFTLAIPENTKKITASYTGYQSLAVSIDSSVSQYAIALQPAQHQSEIVVIGTRNLSRTNVQTPVAVDIIPVDVLSKQTGQADLNQLLTFAAPSFQSSRQAVSDGTDHVDPAQLRGLGNDQVLVLVNGKRRHPSALVNVNGTVNRGQTGTDLNSIPVTAIERVEILRDGAAAQYGSDAIAGVINIVLKKSTGVLNAHVSYGENITSYQKNYAFDKLNHTEKNTNIHDGNTFQAGLNYGFNFNNKGYLNITGEYGVRNATNRTGTYTGPVFANVNGVNRDDSILNARSLTRNNFDMRIGNSKITSGGLMLNAGFDLKGGWNIKFFGGFTQKNGEAAGFFRYPSSISSTAGIYTSQSLALYPNGFLPLIKSNISDYSFSAGLDGKLGKWSASLSNTFGMNQFDFAVDHSLNFTQFAISASPQTKFKAGGLAFLQNTINADISRNVDFLKGLNIAYGAEFRIDRYAQHAGEESSYKNFNTSAGAASGAQVFAGFVPDYAKAHSRSNLAAYIDLEQDFTKLWLLELAARFENYSDFGRTFNYKVATRYKLSEQISLRAAASTGFRAPSMQQQFYAKTNTIFVSTPSGLVPTESGTFTNDSKPAQILGIPQLKEETSQNYSAGLTIHPAKGFDITVDAYIINIKNRIVLTNNFTGGTDTVLTRLLKENGATTANFFTNAIDTKSKGLEAVLSFYTRTSNATTIRFSLAASFIKNEVKKGADGKPIIKASDILINSGQLGNYFNREDQSRMEVAGPQSKGNFVVQYTHKKFGALLRLACFGKVSYLDPSINPSNPDAFPVNAFTGKKETLDQVFGAKTVTTVSLSYDLNKNFTVMAGADNIFDVYPDKQTHSSNVSLGRFIYSRRVQQMGFNGRYVFARLSLNLNTHK